ncbi:hypothetical protein IB234_15245 [Pseudomonas sp. PDM16]|uniref:hypothetical protein n=1 Tax=Pseudomonas sp. PDM16 TaxID=2769292 RepID=UPI00177AD6D2|nr:hypothetical protein [Pseudomonas sp. PDM16]MBD9415917.1 hypothetical protein [Pseudomonas sp. PDM16]
MTRPRIDWVAVERDYRTGVYSNRELSRMHGVSEAGVRKRAADHKWARDLAAQIRQRVQEKTNRAAAQQIASAETDAEIVENAALVGASIVQDHQKLIRRARGLADKLMELLEKQLEAGKIKVQVRGGGVVEIDLPLDYAGKTLGNATTSMERAIRLERQAYGLDDEGTEKVGKSLDELLDEVAEE